MTNLPELSYTARDYQTIVAQLITLVQQTRPNDWTDFSSTDLGQTLLTLVAAVGDILSYGQDQVAQEIFLATCQNYDSGIRFANSVGYVPKAALAASALMTSTGVLPVNLTANGGTIPALTTITGINGLVYEIEQAYTVNIGDTSINLTITNGKTITDTFTPSAQQSQVVSTTQGIVQDKSWSLFVGDPSNPSNEWTQVDNITFETSATNTYSVSINADGTVSFTFGDGSAGAIPNAEITIIYRICDGASGNCPVGAITGSVKVNVAGGGTVSVTLVNQNTAAQITGGTQLHDGENQGLTVASATQAGTLSAAPVLSGTFNLTIILPSSGGQLVLQDTGLGTFSVITNTTGKTLSSSAITYSSGAWSIVLSSAVLAGGSITASYYAVVAASSATAASVGAATGGQDRETLTQLKQNIPAYIRSQGRIETIQDYQDNLITIPGIVLAFVQPLISSYTSNFVKVAVWGSESFQFQSEDTAGSLDPAVTYQRYAQVGDDQVTSIQAFLASRTLLTVSNVILRPTMLWADVYLGGITCDQRVPSATIRAAITAAVVSVFQSSAGFVVRQADIMNAVRQATGVLYFNMLRVATGSQQTSSELQGVTSASTTVSGTLQNTVATPGSVQITINQSSSLTIVIEDNGAGAFTVLSGTAVLASSSIDYHTGAWSATFTSTLIASQVVAASYANVLNDYRAQQVVVEGIAGGDNWPPPGLAVTSPINTPPYKDGVPLSAMRPGSLPKSVSGITEVFSSGTVTATVTTGSAHGYSTGSGVLISGASPSAFNGTFTITVTGANTFTYTFSAVSDPGSVTGSITALLTDPAYPYAINDILTYDIIGDIEVDLGSQTQNFYNEAFLFNNEILYDSVGNLSTNALAINLRRLIFDLVPV
jgi:hypothetical protein